MMNAYTRKISTQCLIFYPKKFIETGTCCLVKHSHVTIIKDNNTENKKSTKPKPFSLKRRSTLIN
jgi:hypothetical protein